MYLQRKILLNTVTDSGDDDYKLKQLLTFIYFFTKTDLKTIDGESQTDDTTTSKKPKHSTKKHRSVLQIKLGKLALQIGYGGMCLQLQTA